MFCLSGDDSKSDEEEESMSEGEMAKLMEEVEEKKKLIANIRNKPWRMRRRLKVLNLKFDLLLTNPFSLCVYREAQQFVDKFEGALGKGKGRKLYAYKVMMMKPPNLPYMLCDIQKWIKFQRDFENFRTSCIPWERKIKEVESKYL
ncbi:hypothetical protein cypCar_00038467 [Cyprinus carpio]|nr:hypothetical protein cypCar_00038467 [Cyprinus carpio]